MTRSKQAAYGSFELRNLNWLAPIKRIRTEVTINSSRNDKDQLVRAELVKLLYRNAPIALVANVVNGLLLGVLLWDAFPRIPLIAWVFAVIIVSLSRWLLALRFQQRDHSADCIEVWASRYTMGAFVAGTLWGLAGVATVTSGVVAYEAFTAFLLGGMAVGSIATSASWRPAYLAFMMPFAIPVTLLFIMGGDKLHIIMGAFALVFLWLLLRTAHHLNAGLRQSLALGFENSVLVSDLRRAKDALECNNRELQAAIKDQRKARESLAESEQRFRTLAETTSAAIFVYSDKFEYSNPAAEAISGYTADEASTVPMTQLVHPDYRDIVIDRIRRRLKGEAVSTRYEVKILTKTDQERWVDITAGLINYGGKPAVLGTAVDITEHKQTEAALRLEKELAQVPLESIGEGVVTTDINGKVKYLNPMAEQLTGWKQREAQG